MENTRFGSLAAVGALPADLSNDDSVSGWGGYLFAWVKTVVTAAVYTKLIVIFLFQVARVDGQSMAPTLTNRDRLIVNKFTYQVSAPRKGDIVMFYYPVDPTEAFVKRVVA